MKIEGTISLVSHIKRGSPPFDAACKHKTVNTLTDRLVVKRKQYAGERGLRLVNAEQASEGGLVLNEREQQWENEQEKMVEAGKSLIDSDTFLKARACVYICNQVKSGESYR